MKKCAKMPLSKLTHLLSRCKYTANKYPWVGWGQEFSYFLKAVLSPLYQVKIQPNKVNTGLVTVSGNFTSASTATLKVKSNTTETFQNWSDINVKSITTSKLYSFTMGTSAVTNNVMFKGGSTVSLKHEAMLIEKRNVIKTTNGKLIISIQNSVNELLEVDINGKPVFNTKLVQKDVVVDISTLRSGIYWTKCKTTNGFYYYKVNLR